ncbi:hypothetical protein RhiJN_25017 [Ceratobasidium sp. AG-Ba]|nr:hypothetical protein RhiJN_25006 [Ceratobasidium sp. AG-Ba]QRV96998.1 hypothetical protein RhiJN_25017 [Ceratobasidium sp. AG-Ba]
MAPRKSRKARGKARARRSPTPTLTPPLTGRRGRPAGAGTYTATELRLLLKVIRQCKPRANSDWAEIERRYNSAVLNDRPRRADNLRTRFNKLLRFPKPSGDPEANELHEEAVLISDELDGLEHTHILDDSPVSERSDGETINLSSSDSDVEILDKPAPTHARSKPAAASAKRKAEPSPAFRAVARKVGSNSRPAHAQTFLDNATAQIASVFNPASEERLANRQRDDITIITLNDTIRDLQNELRAERERRFTMERQLRDEEMRRLVEAQVQQQLQQHLSAHLETAQPMPLPQDNVSWPNSTLRPTAGEAHPSWMPGPPPERTDASGSGGD